MTTPAEQAQLDAVLEPDELSHLHRLTGSWSLLSDLSFSDLVLVVPVSGAEGGPDGSRMVVLSQ
ncbi:MAG: histidine kinase N-terminal domain-containing protein, partial [Acidimicrobiales bacterium]